nr:Sea37 [Serratia proteamaculans]ULG14119.1 Sea37 [Serratia proteamaculans]ULG14518.1 Sea37 [Serratia proteamaculans]ULG16062.1 Sea37 [Serratia proteamaculans]ULG16173.1 Sea37 [Serratia proteamaculans]
MTDRREGVRTGEDTGNANPCRRSGTATFGLRRKPRRRHTLLVPACRAEKGKRARRLISGGSVAAGSRPAVTVGRKKENDKTDGSAMFRGPGHAGDPFRGQPWPP